MKKFILLIITFLTMHYVSAALPQVVAMVNDKPITFYDLNSRKQIIFTLNNIQNPTRDVDFQISQMALKSLIDEILIFEQAEKFGIKVSENEVNEVISGIEQKNKLLPGYMTKLFHHNALDYDNFKAQIKSEVVKMNILSYFSRGIKVSNNEIFALAVSNPRQDAVVSFKVFTSKDKSNKNFVKMKNLQAKLGRCDKIKPSIYQDFSDLENFNKNLRDLSPLMKSIVLDLKLHNASNVFEDEHGFKTVLLCSRSVPTLTKEESSAIVNALTDYKISHKASKFMQDMRKKARIHLKNEEI